MLSLPVFGIGVLALLAVWKFMLRPSLQDTFKDQLFDVRDDLRYHFAARGQLATPAYEELRDTVNGYIRFVEVANLALTYRFAVKLNEEPKVAERYFAELDRRFDVKVPELAGLVHASRRRCSRIIQFYVFHSSFFSIMAIYFWFVPAALLREFLKFCQRRAARSWKSLWRSSWSYVQAREDRAIEPHHTELFSQVDSLSLACAP